MKTISLAAAASLLGLSLVTSPGLQAAELKVLAGGGIAGPMRELGARFERASGHKLVFRFGTTPELIGMAKSDGPFDLGVVPVDVFRDPEARARFAAGATPEIARVGLGVAVRAGSPKPDISTPDALKHTLLKAQSIATIPASATGSQLLKVFERLGITEEMRSRIKPQPAPAALVQAVAGGDAELGVFLTNVLAAPGLDLVGPFPAEVQQNVVFASALAADPGQAEAANAFIAFLKSPEAAAVIKSQGMTPG